MLTKTTVAADPAPTKMTARARETAAATAVAVLTAGWHKIDGRVLKAAESNSMNSTTNGGARGGRGAGAAVRVHDRDREREQSTVQRLVNIIKCINCSRYRWKRTWS